MNKFASDVLTRANQKLAALTNEGMTKQAGITDAIGSGLAGAANLLKGGAGFVGDALSKGYNAVTDVASDIIDRATSQTSKGLVSHYPTSRLNEALLWTLPGAAMGGLAGFTSPSNGAVEEDVDYLELFEDAMSKTNNDVDAAVEIFNEDPRVIHNNEVFMDRLKSGLLGGLLGGLGTGAFSQLPYL